MKFQETPIPGGYLVSMQRHADNRGFFARAFCDKELADQGIPSRFVQSNFSRTKQQGTIRGLHMQTPPHEEIKMVRCIRGAIFDVFVDMRPDSPTYLQWFGTELSEDNLNAVIVPKGCAHGFQSLTDDVDLYYTVSEHYAPGSELGYRFDDPAFGIEWPLPVSVISDKDAAWPLVNSTSKDSA